MAYSTDLVERVRVVAGRLAAAFVADQELAERLNDAQARLLAGNGALWSGIHPDGLGSMASGWRWWTRRLPGIGRG